MDPPVQIFHNIWTGGPIFVKYLDLGVLPRGGGVRFFCDSETLLVRATVVCGWGQGHSTIN